MGEALIARRGGNGGSASGANVWQRGNYTPPSSATYKFSFIDTKNVQLNATGVPISDLIGMKIQQSVNQPTQNYFIITNATTITRYSAGSASSTASLTYNQSTGKLTMGGSLSFFDPSAGVFAMGSKTVSKAEVFDILDYVVDDDASAYPNNALHTDGLYYRLLAQVASANVMSLSDEAVATVQDDYRTQVEGEVSQS